MVKHSKKRGGELRITDRQGTLLVTSGDITHIMEDFKEFVKTHISTDTSFNNYTHLCIENVVISKIPNRLFEDPVLLPNLTKLTFKSCKIDRIDHRAFSHGVENQLEELVFINCQIRSMADNAFSETNPTYSKLNTLIFFNVNIEIEMLTSLLRNLRNPITGMSELPKLKTLVLFNCNITSLSNGLFIGLENLEKLDLRKNKISDIEEGAFTGLYKLKDLNLSLNQLRIIKINYFRGLSELGNLNLSFNNIRIIEQGSFRHLHDQRNVMLLGNPMATQTEAYVAELINYLSNKEADHDCPICGDYLGSVGRIVVRTGCEHWFHTDCLDTWFNTIRSNYNCPKCRMSLDRGYNSDGQQNAIVLEITESILKKLGKSESSVGGASKRIILGKGGGTFRRRTRSVRGGVRKRVLSKRRKN